MNRRDKASPFVPTEIHVGTVKDDKGALGILSIHTTEGLLDIALDLHAADAIVNAIGAIRSRLALVEAKNAPSGRRSFLGADRINADRHR
ncbi:hypothetical protein [Mesorhizobium sp. M1D.F.Ca.ET.043.01.1.1]|uniref:hypothetical protein n=1 Tax=Mesorhizobium sp. M1D.F.Ca.ET.043.01.1.1 TaxID=2493669 RepID=UPI001FDFF5B8|nr:hypothetical protein [Mesorhizobium sp. M1D.F.Ca.ET.043.01.1.1]